MHCWLCQIVMLGQAFGERRVVSICIDVSVDFLVVKFYWLTECRMNFIRSRSWFRVAHGLVWLSEGLLYQKNTWKNPSLQRMGWRQDQKDAKKCRAYFGIKTFGSSGRSARQELFGVIVCLRLRPSAAPAEPSPAAYTTSMQQEAPKCHSFSPQPSFGFSNITSKAHGAWAREEVWFSSFSPYLSRFCAFHQRLLVRSLPHRIFWLSGALPSSPQGGRIMDGIVVIP